MADRSTPFDGLEELIDRLTRQLETAARTWESEVDQRSNLDLSMGGTSTRLDLADRGDEYVVTVDVPGYERDDLEIRLRGETLAVRGERERDREERGGPEPESFDEGDDAALEDADREAVAEDARRTGEREETETYIRRERETRSFSRQVRLPDPVDAEAATATVNNGVLTVRLPKVEASGETREIDID